MKLITDVFVNMRSLVYRDNRKRENRHPGGVMIQAGESSAGKQGKSILVIFSLYLKHK